MIRIPDDKELEYFQLFGPAVWIIQDGKNSSLIWCLFFWVEPALTLWKRAHDIEIPTGPLFQYNENVPSLAGILQNYPQNHRIRLPYLDLPILSPDPQIANLYASKSGTKRIFLAAKVDIPPSEFDIYSLPQVRTWKSCRDAKSVQPSSL